MKNNRKLKLLTLVLTLIAVFSFTTITAAAAGNTVPATVAAASAPSAGMTAEDYKAEVVRLVNLEREKAGVADLTVMDKLSGMADVRAEESSTSFKHIRPDGSKCFTIFADYSLKYQAVGENLAFGYDTPEEVVQAWMDSPSHKQNILDPDFLYIGIGYYVDGSGTVFCSQLFYTPRSK